MKKSELKQIIKEELSSIFKDMEGSNKYVTLISPANLFFNFLKTIKNLKTDSPKAEEYIQNNLQNLKKLQRNLRIAKLNYPMYLRPLSGALDYVNEIIDGIAKLNSPEEISSILGSGYIVKEFLDNVITPLKSLPITKK